MTTIQLIGIREVAAHFGVKPATVSKWQLRYADTPEPDYMVSGAPGWVSMAAWDAWNQQGR
jgi:transposase